MALQLAMADMQVGFKIRSHSASIRSIISQLNSIRRQGGLAAYIFHGQITGTNDGRKEGVHEVLAPTFVASSALLDLSSPSLEVQILLFINRLFGRQLISRQSISNSSSAETIVHFDVWTNVSVSSPI
ncbi:hypothetical protein V3481_013647 [Fusarium oxysporum f. sp. vasinfectum]